MRTLLEAREQLANLQRYMNGKSAAQDLMRQLLSDPEMMKLLESTRDEAAPDAESGAGPADADDADRTPG